MARDFIQETIDILHKASEAVEKEWLRFQNGEINKKEFEEEYHHILYDWVIDTLQDEVEFPNNNCKYQDTKPDCEYFKDSNC